MDLENMRSNWQQMNQRLASLESEVNLMKIEKMETSQQRLVSQYRRMSILALVFSLVLWMPLKQVLQNPLQVLAFCGLLLIAAAMDFYLMLRVKALNIAEMSVSSVAVEARECRRLHHIFQLILFLLAIALLLWMGLSVDDEYFRFGLIAGAIVGTMGGLKIYMDFMRNYKALTKNKG